MKREQANAVWSAGDCPTGKRCHPDRASAKNHSARIRRTSGEHLRPYECPDCGMWHVGHLPDDVLRGIRTADQHYQRGAQ